MKTMDKHAPFDGDGWRPEVKFFADGAKAFFLKFIEIDKAYGEGLEQDWANHNPFIIDEMKVEGTDCPRKGYVEFVDSVIKTFLMAHFCADDMCENEEEDDERLKTIFRYARAVSSVFEESCFKFSGEDER